MLGLSDVIRFIDKQPNGSARVQLPTLIGCPHCNGLRGINVAGKVIMDPVLAVQVSLVIDGYNLRHNEETSGRGKFAGNDGHDGWPDDWQSVADPQPCSCDLGAHVMENAA